MTSQLIISVILTIKILAGKILVLKKGRKGRKIMKYKHALWHTLTILPLYTYEIQQTASEIP